MVSVGSPWIHGPLRFPWANAAVQQTLIDAGHFCQLLGGPAGGVAFNNFMAGLNAQWKLGNIEQ